MIETRFNKLTLSEIRKELWSRRCLSDVVVGETVLRLSLDRPNDLSTKTVSKINSSSVCIEWMSDTQFDKTDGYQLNHKGHSKGYVCFNTKGLSEDDISVILATYLSMDKLVDYINIKLKPYEIMAMKSLIFAIKKFYPNDMCNAIYKFINKLIKGKL